MSRIGSNPQSLMIREISNHRTEMDDLQRQLASGKVADSYGGLGSGRTMSIALRSEMTQIEGFRETITMAQTRVSVMDQAVGQLREHASNTRGQIMVGGFDPLSTGQTLSQAQARTRLSDSVELLNTEVAGRHLFAGVKNDEAPVRPPSELLDGAGGKAGFRQIMDERRQADLGADGKGRLTLAANGPAGVTLSEDFAASPFGFKLEAARSGLQGVTTTGPAGDPATLDIDFAVPLPQNGEQIVISVELPDGTTDELTLRASTGEDLNSDEFAVGADAATTAANFQTALSSLLSAKAETTLEAASMQAAANDFFTSGSDLPQRVDGPPFDGATALRDATDDDTVVWYTGDRSATKARETSLARVDENTIVAYGAKADEEAFANTIKQFAILSSAVFDSSDDSDYSRYTAMTDRVSDNLGTSIKSNSIDRVVGELAIAQNSLNEADKRHIASDNMVTNFLSEIETADINEVATKLLQMQTQLQASYQVTSMLSKLSLVNFL